MSLYTTVFNVGSVLLHARMDGRYFYLFIHSFIHSFIH